MLILRKTARFAVLELKLSERYNSAGKSATFSRAGSDSHLVEALTSSAKASLETLFALKESAERDAELLQVSEMLNLMGEKSIPCLDVRSPAEFEKGHIPGAISVSLLDNEERHQVGLSYSRQGKGPAMILGMKKAKPKLDRIREKACEAAKGTRGVIGVHCWRGGMRSKSVQPCRFVLSSSTLLSIGLT